MKIILMFIVSLFLFGCLDDTKSINTELKRDIYIEKAFKFGLNREGFIVCFDGYKFAVFESAKCSVAMQQIFDMNSGNPIKCEKR